MRQLSYFTRHDIFFATRYFRKAMPLYTPRFYAMIYATPPVFRAAAVLRRLLISTLSRAAPRFVPACNRTKCRSNE